MLLTTQSKTDIGLISDDKRLPKKYDPNYKLQEIDANSESFESCLSS